MVNTKILGMPLAMLVIGLLVVGGVSAALLSYYVNIVGATDTEQSVVWWDGETASVDTKTYAFASNAVAGRTYDELFTIKNQASVPATVELETECLPTWTLDCEGISWMFSTIEQVYAFEDSIQIVDSYYMDVSVVEDGDWIKWTFEFPVETWEGDGQLPFGLIIATDGFGEGPAFQIHNNDGSNATYPYGTWLFSPWGPTIDDGWFGWHSGSNNTLVSDLGWVEASGAYYAQGEDGVLVVRIKKEELGNNFHWAAYPQTGGGWFSPYKNQQMPTPSSFTWSNPIVGADNYHSASFAESGEIVGPFTLAAGEVLSFNAHFEFDIALMPDTFNIETQVVPATME
jgi:hypothetical protein